MPAGVSWTKYLTFSIAAFLTMLAGAQSVHLYYKPLDDLDNYLQKEVEKFKKKKEEKS